MKPDAEIFRHTLREEAKHVGIALSTRQLDAFCQHYELLLKWNPRIRLVATTDPARAARELFADSLVLARFVERFGTEPPGAGTSGNDVPQMVDIGAGAGLVGIPLKLLWPHWGLVVIDKNAKKVAFAKTAARRLSLTSIQVIRGRAEEVAHGGDFRERFDLAFCRAVAPPTLACELAVPFLKVGGSFIAQTGKPRTGMESYEGPEDLRAASRPLGATIDITESYTLTGLASDRFLVRIRKCRPTPSIYPRDARAMRKRPLV